MSHIESVTVGAGPTYDLNPSESATTATMAETPDATEILGAVRIDEDFADLARWTTSGVTVSSGKFAASVDGVQGYAVLPLWGGIAQKGARCSFIVTARKSGTASNRSTVGVNTNEAPGLIPGTGGGRKMFGVGYKQGVGLCFIRDGIGADVVILADASITDGTEYLITFWWDQSLSADNANRKFYANVQDRAGNRVLGTASTVLNPSLFVVTSLVMSTNDAAGNIRQVRFRGNPYAPLDFPAFSAALMTDPVDTSQDFWIRVPTNPRYPLRLVMVCHGHGSTPTTGDTFAGNVNAEYKAMLEAGFTIVYHRMGGDLWGNDAALNYVKSIYDSIKAVASVHEYVHLRGDSMGGAAAAAIVAKGILPVKSVALSQPVLDLEWAVAQAGFTASINAAYPVVADRDDNDPMKQAASAYGDVPFYITASASDTTAVKANNADAFATLLGAQVTVQAVTGNHNDGSHYRAADVVKHFLSTM